MMNQGETIYKDLEGYQYRNLRFNDGTKTLWYEMKKPNERWSGPFHGRLQRDFDKMERLNAKE